MKTDKMPLSAMNPAPYNPRVRLRPGQTQYEALSNSIDRYGLVKPIVVNSRTGNIISGHQRYYVLQEMGETEAEVVLVDKDETAEKQLNIELNKVGGDWDFEKLDELLAEISAEDIKYTGFTPDEIGDLSSFEEDDIAPLDLGEKEPAQKAETGFTVYISCATKEVAEEWLAARGLDADFSSKRVVTIRMKGAEYDTGH